MTLVIDASVAFWACGEEDRFATLGGPLLAPHLLLSEVHSALHEAKWRGEVSADDAQATIARLETAPIEARAPATLRREAWALAEELGWAKTYDAEYLALARIEGTRVVTLDGRLRRGAARTGLVVALDELLREQAGEPRTA